MNINVLHIRAYSKNIVAKQHVLCMKLHKWWGYGTN